MYQKTLSTLAEGEMARVIDIKLKGAINSRLRSLGLIEGRKVKCLHRSTSGSISAYFICGAVIAVRKEDADRILTE